MSVARFFDVVLSCLLYGAPPILFIIFSVLSIIHIRKAKKKEERPVKAIVFGVIATVALMYTFGELFLVIMLAAAVSHM